MELNMPINWPPSGTPSWPPEEISDVWFSTSNLRSLIDILLENEFTHEAPTGVENTQYFADARCDHGHPVIGRMIVSPDGLRRYPIAVCNSGVHRDVLVLWPPYYCGFDSANYTW
jgi:hypothetical protein